MMLGPTKQDLADSALLIALFFFVLYVTGV